MRATTPRRWAAAASASRSASVMAALAFRDAPCDPGEPQRVRASEPVPHPVAVAVKSDGIEFVVAKRSEGVVDLHGSAHGHGSVVPALGNAGQVVAFGAVGGGRGRVQPAMGGGRRNVGGGDGRIDMSASFGCVSCESHKPPGFPRQRGIHAFSRYRIFGAWPVRMRSNAAIEMQTARGKCREPDEDGRMLEAGRDQAEGDGTPSSMTAARASSPSSPRMLMAIVMADPAPEVAQRRLRRRL